MTKKQYAFPLPEPGTQIVVDGVTFTAFAGDPKFLSATNVYCVWKGGVKGDSFYQNANWGYVLADTGVSHEPDRLMVARQAIERARRKYEAACTLVAEYEA